MDTVGNQGAHTEIQAIKIAVPQAVEWIVDKAIHAAEIELNPAKRTAFYQQADTQLANDIPAIPLYASPQILVYKSAVKGMSHSNNPTSEGPTWNAEAWHW